MRFLKTVFALCTCALLCALVWATGSTRLSALEGERSYYLYSPSSQAEIKNGLALWELTEVKGESVTFASDGEIAWILELYSAEVVWIEQAGGVTSYYCHTPKWSEGARVGGRFVNLHIAVGQGRCSVGTPLIFGGF